MCSLNGNVQEETASVGPWAQVMLLGIPSLPFRATLLFILGLFSVGMDPFTH